MSDASKPPANPYKRQVAVADLRKGMYVCELDRPWLDSPFLLQGFPIRTDRELEVLRQLCTFVYVDTQRSAWIPPDLPPVSERPPTPRLKIQETPAVLKPPPTEPDRFREDMERAGQVRQFAHDYVLRTLEDVRLGRSIDTKQAREMVTTLANQVVEAPSAMVWMTQLKQRDEYTSQHSVNVCILSLTFGRFLGLEQSVLNTLGLGALLHDVGKLKVPLEILNKPGALRRDEFQIMMSHPEQGHALLARSEDVPAAALDVVLHHHERSDGRGYPHRLTHEQIPFLTKVVSIVDIYDAISSDRIYHDRLSAQEALNRVYRSHGLDRELVESFIRCIGIYPIGALVELTNGQVAVVVGLNEHQRLRPVVMLLREADHTTPTQRRLINLASDVWRATPEAPAIRQVLLPGDIKIDLRALIREQAGMVPGAQTAEHRA
jgi:HD-GYP domain-containing protein (c-di-GMP phosphodiesterase class II)